MHVSLCTFPFLGILTMTGEYEKKVKGTVEGRQVKGVITIDENYWGSQG